MQFFSRRAGSAAVGREAAIVRQPTIQDVAVAAGVSASTVSRTLSNPDLVADATRRSVEAAIERTGYRLNVAARNLRQRRTGGIVALVPNIANPFFSEILAGISSVLRGAGFGLLVADTEELPEANGGFSDFADRSRADGLIVLDGTVPSAVLTAPRCPPVVLACEWIDGLAVPGVRADNCSGARLAVEHLAALGHTRIGHVAGPEGNVLTRSRRAAFAEALAERGLAAPTAWHFPGDFSLESGRRAAEAFLALADRPTALFCASDMMACGLIGGLVRAGLSVPGDVSVVGFDDVDLVAHTVPALTTIRQPRRRIGELAARMLLDTLGGEAPEPAVLSVELVVRDSTAPPRGNP